MFSWRPVLAGLLVSTGAAVTLATVWAAPAQDVPLEELLARLGAYVVAYERDMAAVVSEETYEQTVAPQGMLAAGFRKLKAEVLMARTGETGWVTFRDVVEVDGRAVTDRADRLIQLFITPTGDSGEQVMRIIEASAKYNLGWVRRTINYPTMVLEFARPGEQARSQFRRGGTTRVGGIEAREIRFTERAMPRLIKTPDDAAAFGSFWVEEATGRILRTELRVTTGSTTSTIGVSYGHQPKLDLWLPVLMIERYSTPRQPTISGRAIYTNFRRFDVQVATIIK
ncbi:MAG: hypothetical protein NUW22_02075 [Acidobacteria bacterium]|nr:hypothetical protein [Acidobacteriota bacterium]